MPEEGGSLIPSSKRYLNLLSEGVSLQLRVDELSNMGRIEDWQAIRPTKNFGREMRNAENNVKARRRYLAEVREWMAQMETTKDACLAARTPQPTETRTLTRGVADLERRLGKYGNMSPVAEARAALCGAGELSDLEEGEIMESPSHRGANGLLRNSDASKRRALGGSS
ncbi:hypothetical protein LshimejAT787_0107830 [Lyophyllum shimeji]|uniref:Uncharacterized protein n=1 Tax=Lyophyllum shimeji TaxID=47721 RepID=A0A9P3PEA0_LYOSH|nr:hypothetical protein LshimejAT787_0107830 [Lyophyllum shimeji]